MLPPFGPSLTDPASQAPSANAYTHAQLMYFAHWLTRAGPSSAALINTAAQSRVDLNPHQVDAALFALRATERSSVFAKGVLLADEVGLGKTIEAGLVLAQHWAAKKRRLLLVVPASLRKQWQQELADKFQLQAEIIDGQSAQSGGSIFTRGSVLIVSYEFASKRYEEIAQIDWHLVVFDEAHRLRNLHKDRLHATNLLTALGSRRKILLTATPFQNSLSELWSLVHFLDQDYLGDLASFELQYRSNDTNDARLRELSQRLAPICQRTLRRQVAEDGQISFTRRYAITLDFSPSADEVALYNQVSEWLLDPESVAFSKNSRHLVTMVIRKILASSSFAISATLEKVIERLESEQSFNIDDALAQETTFDQEFLADKAGVAKANKEKLLAELATVKSYRALAARISSNAKGDALLVALKRAFESNQNLAGSARKAVIFTESVRTQSYLKTLLESNGYSGRVVLLNGSNADESSKRTYSSWFAKNRDTANVSKSKSADMKAAIVAAFRDDADIMIATESGAEGINLQFCQILVNFDLPWNPQRIEQRIGRVHRYGQKCDVIVVNFVNTQNQVDRQVHDLLRDKLKLFDGVFGASDEVLGALENGIDLEFEINKILEQRRGEDEITKGFNELRAKLDDVLRVTEAQTREKVLANFDTDVLERLRDRRSQTQLGLSERQRHWMAFARGALGAVLEPQAIAIDGHRYAMDWQVANQENIALVHADLAPFQEALAHWVAQSVPSDQAFRLSMRYRELGQKLSDVEALIGASGVLHCCKVIAHSMDAGEYLVVSACTADGAALDADTARRLLLVPASAGAATGLSLAPALAQSKLELAHLDSMLDQQNQRWFDQESERLERWGDDQNAALQVKVKDLDREIKDRRKAMRAVDDFKQRVEIKRELATLETRRDAVLAEFYQSKKKISDDIERLIDLAEQQLSKSHEVIALFTVEWELNA
jgi:ERCC4-related helicase